MTTLTFLDVSTTTDSIDMLLDDVRLTSFTQFLDQTLLFDFGDGATTTDHGPSPDDPVSYWNNVTTEMGTSSTGQLQDVVTAQNSATSVGLQMVSRFAGVNPSGTLSSAVYAQDATRDSLYGNTELFSGLSDVFPEFKLTGLNPSWSYDLIFYASRAEVSDNRETGYTVVGANSGYVALDAANNVNNTATVLGIVPTEAGEISVSLAPTANNNNANHFTYLGALIVEGYSSIDSFEATYGEPVNYTINATNNPTIFSVSGLPPGLDMDTTTGVISGTPTLAGTYRVTIEASNEEGTNYIQFTVTIAKVEAVVTLSGLTQTYDGSPRSVSATTSPAGLSVVITYDGSETPPTNVGSYSVVATIDDPNYAGAATGVLTIGELGTLENGSFESDYLGWDAIGNQGIANFAPYQTTDGANVVVFNWGENTPNGVLSQTFVTTPGQTYTVSFDVGVLAYNKKEQRLQVTVDGAGPLVSETVSVFGLGGGQTQWVSKSYSFVADSTMTTLTFLDVSTTTNSIDMLLDDVRLTL